MAEAGYLWPLLAVAAFLVMLGLQKGWQASLGALFRSLADAIDRIPTLHVFKLHVGFGAIAAAIRDADASVYNWIGQAVRATESVPASFIRYMADVFSKPAQQVALMAADLLHTLTLLRTVVVPRMIAAHVAWIPRHLIALAHRLDALALRAPVHIVHAVTRVVPHITRVTIAKAVAVPWPRIGRVERDAAQLGKRIDRLAHRVAPAALAASIGLVLARTVGGWIKCSRVKKVGRGVCGMDDGLLESLLADTALIVGTVSLVEFARGMQDVTAAVAPEIRAFWRAT